VIDYKDNAGKRRLKTFPTRKEADDWATTARQEIQQGTHTPTSASITVSEGMDLWIAGGEADGLEYSTVRQRQEHKRLHIDPFIGNDKLATLTAPRVYELDSKLRDAGRSFPMRRKVLTSLKTMLKFCQGQGKVAQNVALAVKIKSDSKRDVAPVRAGVNFPNREELRVILDKAANGWRPFVITAIFTGIGPASCAACPGATLTSMLGSSTCASAPICGAALESPRARQATGIFQSLQWLSTRYGHGKPNARPTPSGWYSPTPTAAFASTTRSPKASSSHYSEPTG
jgi:hypothetical protein